MSFEENFWSITKCWSSWFLKFAEEIFQIAFSNSSGHVQDLNMWWTCPNENINMNSWEMLSAHLKSWRKFFINLKKLFFKNFFRHANAKFEIRFSKSSGHVQELNMWWTCPNININRFLWEIFQANVKSWRKIISKISKSFQLKFKFGSSENRMWLLNFSGLVQDLNSFWTCSSMDTIRIQWKDFSARDMTWRKSIADFLKFSSKIFQFGSRENRRRGFSGHEETNGVFRISKENLMWTFQLSRNNERTNLTTDEVGIRRCEIIEDW